MAMIKRQEGFTIIELLVATAVFSVILLIITYGILDIGRIYTKGLTNSRTQETARAIVEDVSRSIQFDGGAINTGTLGVSCVGSQRYTYSLNTEVQDSPVVHGLVSDNSGSCTAQNFGGSLSATSTELLQPRMRLSTFSISDLGNNLYKVTVKVIYGDNDLLVDNIKADGSAGTDGIYDACIFQRSGSQFCAVSELSTVVQKRVQ